MLLHDIILNNEEIGEHVDATQLLSNYRFHPTMMQPYIEDDPASRLYGSRCLDIFDSVENVLVEGVDGAGNKVIQNAKRPVYNQMTVREVRNRYDIDSPIWNDTLLRKNDWIMVEQEVLRVQRAELIIWGDLAAANTFSGFDGMATRIIEHETVSDIGEAMVDMDGLGEPRGDRPVFGLQGMPLPITYAGWWTDKRTLMGNIAKGYPFETDQVEMHTRACIEKVERTTLGTISGLTYGTAANYGRAPSVYGYRNFPARVIKNDMVAPTGSNGAAVEASFLAFRQAMYDQNFGGPFVMYVSSDWAPYLDARYSQTEPSAGSLRSVIAGMEGFTAIRTSRFLPGPFEVILVQMTKSVARAVIGMPFTPLQWETRGGMQINFRVMGIMAPQLKADGNDQCGIGHGTTS